MIYVVVLVAHWIADLPCQSDWMRLNKWHRWDALGLHAVTYTVVLSLVVFVTPGHDPADFGAWMLVNGGAHFVQDAITSRITHRLWEQQRYRRFFDVICGDQIAHAIMLVVTTGWWLR